MWYKIEDIELFKRQMAAYHKYYEKEIVKVTETTDGYFAPVNEWTNPILGEQEQVEISGQIIENWQSAII